MKVRALVATPDPEPEGHWPTCQVHGILLNARTTGWVCPLGCPDFQAGVRYKGLPDG